MRNIQKQLTDLFCKKRCFKQFRKIRRRTPVPEPETCNFIKKETLAQVFSCEFSEISKNTFFVEHLWATASEYKILADGWLYIKHSQTA